VLLEAEVDEHLGYSKHEQSEHDNSHNGNSVKRLRISEEEISLATPRDRDGSSEPVIVKSIKRECQPSMRRST